MHQCSGDYAWLAERLPGKRVLEVGCGAAYGSRAIAERATLAVVEPDASCRDWLVAAPNGEFSGLVIDGAVGDLNAAQIAAIEEFAPDCVVCWLAGGDESQFDVSDAAAGDPVKAFRERLHRAVAELAAALPTVKAVQLADRTAFPWQIKDTARDTLVAYHSASSFRELPFHIDRADAVFRKLDVGRWSNELRRRGGLVPVLGSLVARKI